MNPRAKCRSIFDCIHEHPSLAIRRIDGAQCRVDGIGGGNAVTVLVKESGVATAKCSEEFRHASFKCFGIVAVNEARRMFIDQRKPRIVVLVWIADVDVTFWDEFLNGRENLSPILSR